MLKLIIELFEEARSKSVQPINRVTSAQARSSISQVIQAKLYAEGEETGIVPLSVVPIAKHVAGMMGRVNRGRGPTSVLIHLYFAFVNHMNSGTYDVTTIAIHPTDPKHAFHRGSVRIWTLASSSS